MFMVTIVRIGKFFSNKISKRNWQISEMKNVNENIRAIDGRRIRFYDDSMMKWSTSFQINIDERFSRWFWFFVTDMLSAIVEWQKTVFDSHTVFSWAKAKKKKKKKSLKRNRFDRLERWWLCGFTNGTVRVYVFFLQILNSSAFALCDEHWHPFSFIFLLNAVCQYDDDNTESQ